MTRLILNPAISAELKKAGSDVVLCDDSGRTLGYFTPVADQSLYKDVQIPFTEEELSRAEREETYSTQEVLDYLKSLEGR